VSVRVRDEGLPGLDRRQGRVDTRMINPVLRLRPSCMTCPDPDYLPRVSLEILRLRAGLLQQTREFFQNRGFLEVETPVLSADVVVDRHLDPIPVTLADDPRQSAVGRSVWLQTSPEFGMKRLLAAGATAIYQITRAFRAGEAGPLHNPEFTMIEWYRTGDGMMEGMSLLSEFAEHLLKRGPADRISYQDAFARHVGLDPHSASVADLRAAAQRHQIVAPNTLGNDRDGWLDLLLVECVQPSLGRSRPTILFDYPASQAALAIVRDAGEQGVGSLFRSIIADSANPSVGSGPKKTPDPLGQPLAERFELFIDGIELANGYHELLDADVLRSRFTAANRQRIADGKPLLPEESRLLAAMEAGLPPCTGVALGFDRLVMIAAGARSLAEVMAFPIDRA
jgi:elongation factor P--(R)-beta-lysine ligase